MGQICTCFGRDLEKQDYSYRLYKKNVLQLRAYQSSGPKLDSSACVHPAQLYEIHSELTLDSEV
jgi:hypothetical protein